MLKPTKDRMIIEFVPKYSGKIIIPDEDRTKIEGTFHTRAKGPDVPDNYELDKQVILNINSHKVEIPGEKFKWIIVYLDIWGIFDEQ